MIKKILSSVLSFVGLAALSFLISYLYARGNEDTLFNVFGICLTVIIYAILAIAIVEFILLILKKKLSSGFTIFAVTSSFLMIILKVSIAQLYGVDALLTISVVSIILCAITLLISE
jgi:hypothetical protein